MEIYVFSAKYIYGSINCNGNCSCEWFRCITCVRNNMVSPFLCIKIVHPDQTSWWWFIILEDTSKYYYTIVQMHCTMPTPWTFNFIFHFNAVYIMLILSLNKRLMFWPVFSMCILFFICTIDNCAIFHKQQSSRVQLLNRTGNKQVHTCTDR